MKCHACGKELTRKEALYTEDRLPYCNNPLVCSEGHPNSVKNILARQGAAQMFSEEELEHNLYENLNVSADMKDRIMKIATKPQSIRLSKVDISYYLIQLQEKHGMNSLSEAIRHCVHVAMNVEPIDAIPAPAVPVIEPQAIQDTNIQPVAETGGIKAVIGSQATVIPDMPQSINVDWDAIKKQIKENPEPEEQEPEEDLVF